VANRIGEHVAALVEDGATIQLGIGDIPQAVVGFLRTKRELGVHTEMFTDSLIDLVESSAVTCSRKTVDRGKVVASFCMGTNRLYDYIDRNPFFSFHPTEYVNDPAVIGKIERMVSINAALEVDLTGQVCADSLGEKFYSGIGGQANFNFGAGRAPGGKAIIALPSTTADGNISRIVARLSHGAGVVTTRGEVHYVVTEYGVAYLHGKSVQERVLALISIAHPDFREPLLREAIELKFVRSELADVEGKIHVGPQELRTSTVLDDGTQVDFRPIHPTDEPRIKDLFYALSQESVFSRWMSHLKRLPREEIHNYVYIDHRNRVAIVCTLPEVHGDEVIAVGGYYLDPRTNRAEVAFTVRDRWQNRGIGTFMLQYLIQIARRNGIAGFTAEVLRQNKAMQMVFNHSECKVDSRLEDGVYCFELNFD
jgi:GNAT superfamily N-acetyltransferase/acyl CoA:acetate/3-ketoacid CoA transferase beta subunit